MSKMIDPNQSRIPIWLVWALTTNGLMTLVGVTLTTAHARSYKIIIERDEKVVRVNIEKSEANHLYNPDWDTAWQSAYGDEHIAQLAKSTRNVGRQLRKQIEHERDQALLALKAAAKRIAELEEALENDNQAAA